MSNLNSTSKLTEFPSLEADEKADGTKFSLSKFMFWRKADDIPPNLEAGTLPGHSSSTAAISENVKPDVVPTLVRSTNSPALARKISLTRPPYYRSDSNLSNPSPEPMDGSSLTVSPFAFEARNVSNVLRRFTNLIAMGTNADLKKYWMPDSVSKECYECAEKFTTFRRKHHCRICGQIFCSRCCNQEIPGKVIGYTGDLRVCSYCCKIVLSYLRSADMSSDLTDDLKGVQEDLQHRFGASTPDFAQLGSGQFSNSISDHTGAYRSLPRRKASTCYQEERFASSKENSLDAFTSNADDKPKIVWDWVSLKSMWDEMLNPVTGIDWATHRHNMMKYCHSCVVGSELVDWLLAQRKITWRGQGVQIGQLLIDANLLECVSQTEQLFIDAYALYKPVQVPLTSVQEASSESSNNSTRNSADYGEAEGKDWGQDPLWVKQIKNPNKIDEESEASETDGSFQEKSKESTSKTRLPSSASLYSLDLNLSDSTVSISKPKDNSNINMDPYTKMPESSSSTTTPSNNQIRTQRTPTNSSASTETMTDEFLQKTLLSQKEKGNEMVAPTGWHSPQQLTSDSELRAFQRLCNSYVAHENDLLNQLLDSMNLSQSWADIILPIVHKVTEIVRPDVRNADDEMDIRQYIQFKKLPGSNKEDCRIVNGVVCTKNVAHRNMRNVLKDPNILLIGSSIDYQRFENRFLSLEPLVMQEHDYLKNTVARIASMKPDLVIVEKTVSRLAQEFMLDHGITLVINLKSSVMERIGRLTQGVIWESADTSLGRSQLGLCHNFYLESFQLPGGVSKTLMFFDGCATHLGCTVLLRGGSNSELMKVKKIISLLMFVAYNWRLERSFHIDSFSMPPEANENGKVSPANNNKEINKMENLSETEEFFNAEEDITLSESSLSEWHPLAAPSSLKNEKESTIEQPEDLFFEKSLDDVILSASPFIKYPLPFLQTELGKNCELRKFFPEIMYWSARSHRSNSFGSMSVTEDIENNNINQVHNSVLINCKLIAEKPQITLESPHIFTTIKLTSAIGSDEVQGLIADFRRKGSRLDFATYGNLSTEKGIRSNASSWNTLDNDKSKQESNEEHIDALDPFKHQRLSVLFCSYSPISANAPYFCVNPWVVNMDMYGRNDISLGMFLERYCFRKTYLCPARQCDTPMLDHIRKFVHYNGCVEVILRELQSPILGSGQTILMWNWCSICRTVSPIVPMSVDSWSVSFAKYLELRFYGYDYTRRGFDNPCTHSLHQDHQHYFAQHSVVAAFKFSKIQLWEISLPQNQISVKKMPKSVAQLIEDVKSVAILGYGVYTNILEVIASLKENSTGLRVEEVLTALAEQQKAERSVFRSKIEDIQVNLASPSLHDACGSKDAEVSLWKVTDSIGFLKCNIAETIKSWNSSLNNFILQRKKEEKLAKDVSTRPQLSRMESEPILPIVKELEDSMRSTGKNSGLDISVELSSSDSRFLDVQPIGSDEQIKRSNSPSPSVISQKVEHERTKSDGTERIIIGSDEVVDSGKTEKRSSSSAVKTIISHFISGTGVVQVIQSPWSVLEHHFPAAYCTVPVTVYENEPSSIVAFALGSTEYRCKLKNSGNATDLFHLSTEEEQTTSGKKRKRPSDGGAEDLIHTSVGSTGSKSMIIPDEKGIGDLDDDKQPKSDGNIEIQFSSNAAKFYCRIYFAENFRQLRKLCIVEGEEFYSRSLARCVSWAASGGKSGSTFCKTIDDRFVIKQMSRFEIQSFLDFAPNYFEYMKTAFLEKKPTVLAKILGVYRIGFKNSQTNAAQKMDILIMENLFYERSISQKFDLKGSIRNRLANVTGKDQEDLVLLDENLVNMACENPMYIRPHTKTILSQAISNDSRFLASQLVMDYSLLVGLDDRNCELVVGIIDYIRTFTWDKKIETFVKSSGILGGQGKTPTVVSPTEYQSRFCEAMDRYFLLVPDRWLSIDS